MLFVSEKIHIFSANSRTQIIPALIPCIKSITHLRYHVEIIYNMHVYIRDPSDLTLFNFMKDIESIPLVNLLWKINCTHM